MNIPAIVLSMRSKPMQLDAAQTALLENKLRDKRMKAGTWVNYRKSDAFKLKRTKFQERNAEFGVIDELGIRDAEKPILFEGSESDMLESFWEHHTKQFHENPATLGPLRHPAIIPGVIGFNVLTWQLPFLLKRTALLGVEPTCKFDLNKNLNNSQVYDCAIHWVQSKYEEPDLNDIAVYFGLDQPNPTLEQEMEMIWQIYHRIQNLL